MSFWGSLDKRDRRLLIFVVVLVFGMSIVAALLTNKNAEEESSVPSSFLNGKHGASAAYELLLRLGYKIDHLEEPLANLIEKSGPGTVVILAEPFRYQAEDVRAVRKILERGGRVMVTGQMGGNLLPESASAESSQMSFAACKLAPEGLDKIAQSGEVWMLPMASWKQTNPSQRVEYRCANQPVVVEYSYGKGTVVWWASPYPLQNENIARANNLDLLLNSIGPAEGLHVYWDESLHGNVKSAWSFSAGPAQTMFFSGLAGLLVLMIASFSRRSGPIRELPARPRVTPMEHLEALGALYQKAGAAETAMTISWERFRRRMMRLSGLRAARLDAAELGAILRTRFPAADKALEKDLLEYEDAARTHEQDGRVALKWTQKLHQHEIALEKLAKQGSGKLNRAD